MTEFALKRINAAIERNPNVTDKKKNRFFELNELFCDGQMPII